MTDAPTPATRPLLGIGACLAGNTVRYDGTANPANAGVRAVCAQFDTLAFCPEVAIGLGVPRPPIHLVGDAQAVRVLDVQTHSRDYTQPLRAYAQAVLRQAPQLCGYILVQGSPSCGYRQVKRFSAQGDLLAADQDGMFAAALAAFDPLLPLEDDAGLGDAGRRARFITRAYAYHEWKLLRTQGLTAQRLRAFHERYRARLPACDAQALDASLADATPATLAALAEAFIRALMAALQQVAAPP